MTDPLALLLASPADPPARLAAADALEDRGQADAGQLLRCSSALLAIPLPDVPREDMRSYVEHGAWLTGWRSNAIPEVSLPTAPTTGPGYVGIAGLGRLPGIAAAIRTAEQLFHPDDPRRKQALLRQLVRSELYACRAIGRRERDAEHGGRDAWIGSVFGHRSVTRLHLDPPLPVTDLWLLRGGPAGRSLLALHACERWRVLTARDAFLDDAAPPDRNDRLNRWPRSPIRRRALALARTYYLALMECFGLVVPWEAARRLYESGRQEARARFDALGWAGQTSLRDAQWARHQIKRRRRA